jgi:tRNA A-37 threonylcarbamoyl transferase component Bud32
VEINVRFADGGTLRDYLRNNTIPFGWKVQLKLAREITSAVLWLHDDRGIIHGDLVNTMIICNPFS